MNQLISVSEKLTSSLPENGWIKPCLKCKLPTSRIFKFFYEYQVYNCYFCKDCVPLSKDILDINFQNIIIINILSNC